MWLGVGLVAAAGLGVGIERGFFSDQARLTWPPEPCVVQGIDARCGSFVVPENRAQPNGPTIGLYVVVLPAFLQPAREDAVAYLAGGPGQPATEEAANLSQQLSTLNTFRDILLVDQRGTGRSSPNGGDVTQYGTRTAMDDLDAVRAALGYRQLDVIGSSYGATAAQVYLIPPPCARSSSRREPRSTCLSSTATPSTPSAPSNSSQGSAPRSPTAERRFRAGSASSAPS
ncbi:MAG TPA: alpha/beta hydrolase [Gemmatimonadaceae bacterium]|nr:alpha/beta hydrolase [Gemmatimonadaceae bacterium]